MKKLGVVVPVYNAGAYLEQCVTSIINQTYDNLEIVLVDDGSTDNSGSICDEYAKRDKRIHVIHQDNQGMPRARYVGLRKLKTEYATFVDADDWIKRDAYEKMAKYMEEEIEVISFSQIQYYSESYEYISRSHFPKGKYNAQTIRQKIFPSLIFNIENMEGGFNPSLCNAIIKTELLMEQITSVCSLSINYGEDMATMFPLLIHVKSMIITDEVLYYYRQRKFNEIAEYMIDKDYYKKLFLFYEYMKKKFEGQEELIKQLDFFYANSAVEYLKKYKQKISTNQYLFPFNKIAINQKIILYGAGAVGQSYYKQLKQLNYGEIVAWVDKNSDMYSELGVGKIESIKDIPEYDYIVIAVKHFDVADLIRQDLITRMKIDEERIIWHNTIL